MMRAIARVTSLMAGTLAGSPTVMAPMTAAVRRGSRSIEARARPSTSMIRSTVVSPVGGRRDTRCSRSPSQCTITASSNESFDGKYR